MVTHKATAELRQKRSINARRAERSERSTAGEGRPMSQVLRFTHLRLKNWRNFTAVDVPLAKRVFVVGPNAVGKSNLLDVFRFLRHLTVEGGGLAQAVKARRGLSRLRSLHQRGRNSDVEIEVKSIDADGGEWRMEMRSSVW